MSATGIGCVLVWLNRAIDRFFETQRRCLHVFSGLHGSLNAHGFHFFPGKLVFGPILRPIVCGGANKEAGGKGHGHLQLLGRSPADTFCQLFHLLAHQPASKRYGKATVRRIRTVADYLSEIKYTIPAGTGGSPDISGNLRGGQRKNPGLCPCLFHFNTSAFSSDIFSPCRANFIRKRATIGCMA